MEGIFFQCFLVVTAYLAVVFSSYFVSTTSHCYSVRFQPAAGLTSSLIRLACGHPLTFFDSYAKTPF